jgi:high-affinity Fe2+/Pb2+ permease
LVASGIVPGVIWLVLLGGALVTIGFTYFFGTENLRAQMLMTGALSLLIFSGLLIIIAIDHPFAGTVRIEPESLALVLKDFGGASSH